MRKVGTGDGQQDRYRGWRGLGAGSKVDTGEGQQGLYSGTCIKVDTGGGEGAGSKVGISAVNGCCYVFLFRVQGKCLPTATLEVCTSRSNITISLLPYATSGPGVMPGERTPAEAAGGRAGSRVQRTGGVHGVREGGSDGVSEGSRGGDATPQAAV